MDNKRMTMNSSAIISTPNDGNRLCNCAKGQVVQVTAFALQKRQEAWRKYYMHVLQVRRSDGSEYNIHKSHSDLVRFDNFLRNQKELATERKSVMKKLPKLPDQVKKTKGLEKITKYFESLIGLEKNLKEISVSPQSVDPISHALQSFFQQETSCESCRHGNNSPSVELSGPIKKPVANESSLNEISPPLVLPTCRVITSYKSDDKRQLSLPKNSVVQLYKKCPSGWWFVISHDNSGWFPASHLLPLEDSESNSIQLSIPEKYKATCDYEAQKEDELSFEVNTILEVKVKNMDGWWLAEYLGCEGFVPASYIRPCETSPCNCYDMCCETVDMKPLVTRSCSKCDGMKVNGDRQNEANYEKKREELYEKRTREEAEEGDESKGREEAGKEAASASSGGIDLMPAKEIIREESCQF